MKKIITGIIGYPLGHTLSPHMHNAGFKSVKINGEYKVFEIKPKELKKMIEKVRKEGIRGLNVTVPYKQKVMKYLDKISKDASDIGAVNTIVNRNGKLIGYNTDYIGFKKSLDKNKVKLKNKKVVIFGAGGAAHAVLYTVKKENPEKISIINIDLKMSKDLVKKLKLKNYELFLLNDKKIDEIVEEADFIIQATSVGLDGKSCVYKIKKLKKKGIQVYDLIYNPLITPFLKYAKEKGGKIINGMDMLIYQGLESFYLWTGKRVNYKVYRNVINKWIKEH